MRAAERAGYLSHASLPAFERRVEASRLTIRAALDGHPGVWAVGCSGGKDSAVLLALCVESGWRGPVLFLRYRETPAENEAMARRLADRFGLPIDVVDVPGAWDVYDAVGYAFRAPATDAEKRATAAMLRGYKQAADGHAAAAGWAGELWGLRRQESKRRAIMLAQKGATYAVADRVTMTCCPLADWSGRDVWAYTVLAGLPWLTCYDWPGEDRERVRSETTWLAEESLWRLGQGERLRRHDPARWSALVVAYPEVQTWA